MHKGVIYALLAAALFGASTPFSKLLVGTVAPVALAGMLYLGSGPGRWLVLRALRQQNDQTQPAGLSKPDLPWLAGAILAGGVAGTKPCRQIKSDLTHYPSSKWDRVNVLLSARPHHP